MFVEPLTEARVRCLWSAAAHGIVAEPHGGALARAPIDAPHCRSVRLVLNTKMRSRRAGARAFFGPQAYTGARWTARGALRPPVIALARMQRPKAAAEFSFYPPFASVFQAASAGAGAGRPAVNSNSPGILPTAFDGFLAISFDNLGAGAQLALSIAEASHRTQVPRNHRIEHLPARAGDTRNAQRPERTGEHSPEAPGSARAKTSIRATRSTKQAMENKDFVKLIEATGFGSVAAESDWSTRTTFCPRHTSSLPQHRKRRKSRHPSRRRRPRRRRRRSRRRWRSTRPPDGHLRHSRYKGLPKRDPPQLKSRGPALGDEAPEDRNAESRRRQKRLETRRGASVRKSKNAA